MTDQQKARIIVIAASKVRQGALILYTTSMKVSDLVSDRFYSVETLDPENLNDKGFQRLLNKARAKKLADYIDCFCETGFFSPEEMELICKAGQGFGLKPKLHVNQLNSIGGIESAIKLNALSVDHLETMTDTDVKLLSNSNIIGTLLPTAAFFLRMNYQPARTLIGNNCAIALATDYNPGSSPSGNMNFVIALSCIQMKMLPEEAINAATINGAYAMELLVNEMFKLGAKREHLQAKIFGGAQVMHSFKTLNVGERNTQFVRQYLSTERIALVSEDVLGLYPRKLCYFPATGKAFVKRLEQVHSEKLLPQDKEKPSNAARLVQTTLGGSVDLF